jgi:hypothetical protein
MIAAMMLPAVLPFVRVYAHAAGNAGPSGGTRRRIPGPVERCGRPAFLARSRLNGPVAHAYPWAGCFAGVVAGSGGLTACTFSSRNLLCGYGYSRPSLNNAQDCRPDPREALVGAIKEIVGEARGVSGFPAVS